ncbi:MAG: YjjG family noncanonical pyrimidine nucleotidase [Clostridia bacterium]|nr:YjjG family noncanonical pyrimidine nucleotidase [Clostridia bacterium]
MARYQTLLFDADQTLLDFLKSERAALIEALHTVGVSPTEKMIETYSAINLSLWKRLERGEITKAALREERFAEFSRVYGLSVSVPLLADNYMKALTTKSFLLDGALEVCQALSQTCRLYVITNGIASVQHGRFDNSLLAPLFLDTFISDEIGAEKPAKAFFDAVFTKIPNFDSKTTLVIGDSLTSDMAGGIAAGLDTCWFNPEGKPIPADMPITYTVQRLEDVIPLVLGQ